MTFSFWRTLNKKMFQPGGRLLQWQQPGVEGGGGWRASFTKETVTSCNGWWYHLRYRWLWCWLQRLHLDPCLGPGGGDLECSWRPECGEILPCCRCRSTLNHQMYMNSINWIFGQVVATVALLYNGKLGLCGLVLRITPNAIQVIIAYFQT